MKRIGGRLRRTRRPPSAPPQAGLSVRTIASFETFLCDRIEAMVAGLPRVSHDEAKQAFWRTLNLGTLAALKALNVSNYRANRYWLKQNPGIWELNDALVDKPVFLVAAGPSLTRNIDVLKRVAGRYTIFAVDAAVPILDQHGIVADYVWLIDTKDVQKRFFSGRPADRSTLCAVSCSHKDAWQSWAGRRLFFNAFGSHKDHEIQLRFGKDLGSIGVGGNVSTAMLWAAVAFASAQTVVFVGHDFSWRTLKGGYYAEGGAQELAPSDKVVNPTWDINGHWVESDLSLWSYKWFTEDFVRDIKSLCEEQYVKVPRFINATEGGVLGTSPEPGKRRTDLFEFRKLADVVDELDSSFKPDEHRGPLAAVAPSLGSAQMAHPAPGALEAP